MDEPNRKRLYPLNQFHDSDSFPDQIEITNQMAPLMSITLGSSNFDQNFIDCCNTYYLNRKKAKRTDYLKDDTYNWCLKENSITSEKRIGHLLNALKEQVAIDHVTKEEFFETSLQYVAKLIEDKKWTGLSSEKAISLALLANYTPKSNKVDLFSCKYCALSYPPGKHECETCEMTFSVEMFLFAHQVTEHGYVSSADETIVCPFCGIEFQNDPILLANHLHDYHLCRFNHIECPEGCSELIVENNPKALQDHLITKHQCQICGDRILNGEYDFHMEMFHSEPLGTTGQTELKSVSNFTSLEVVQYEQVDVDGMKLANQDLQTSNLNSAKIAPRERIQVEKDSQKGDQFDMSSIELHDVTAPEWKVCTTCKMAMKVELLALCMFCEKDLDPFVSMDELILHIWRVHEKKPSITHIVCSFCESTFQNVKGFLVHRELSHDYCDRHYLCGASCNCLLLSDSLEKAAKHIESRDTICHLRYPFTSLKNQKHCFQCKTSVEISYVYYCMFCKMSGFISITELLSHLMKKHRCKVYGQFDCTKYEKSFHDPNRLIHHFKLQHGGCKSHRMCSRTEDCDYVFPSEVPPIIHNCHQDQCYINPTVSQPEQCVDSIHQEMRDDQIAPPPLIRSTTISAPPFLPTKFPQPLAGSSNWCTGLTAPPNFNPDDLVFTEPSYRAQSSNFNPLQSRDISSFYPRSGPPNVQCVNEQPSININVSAVIQEREQLVSYR
ncbi:uncharacterized protein LOC142339770 [Convolutriloba macropyga]|uniref:uncharacterized protein LOC142339770 n=1 Tax=Convolutriloba macropyga TaxID=536237 RepID=UPI003F51ED11